MPKLTSVLAAIALIGPPAFFTPAAAHDHDHADHAAPAPETPPPSGPSQTQPCPMMQGMMGGEHTDAGHAKGADNMPMAGGTMSEDKMSGMPCMKGQAPIATPPGSATERAHDHDHPGGQPQ